MPTAPKVPVHLLTGRRRFNHRVLAALAVVIASLLLAATGYAVYLHRTATFLVTSAREIESTDDALRLFNIWKGRKDAHSWVDSYDSGRGTVYWVQVSNRGIARVHLAPWSALNMRMSLYDKKLKQVSVEMDTPSAADVAEEWFKPEMPERFYLGQIKSAVPTARVEFPSSALCATPEDVLPVVRTLESSP